MQCGPHAAGSPGDSNFRFELNLLSRLHLQVVFGSVPLSDLQVRCYCLHHCSISVYSKAAGGGTTPLVFGIPCSNQQTALFCSSGTKGKLMLPAVICGMPKIFIKCCDRIISSGKVYGQTDA